MTFDDFLKFLWEQEPSGEAGFEGMIAKRPFAPPPKR